MSKKQRPYIGSSIVDSTIRFTSISQIKTFDPKSDGCNRKYAFQYKFGKKLAKTDALDEGINYGEKLEHYLLTGENVLPPVLQPAQKFFPVPRLPDNDLEVEKPLGDIESAVVLRDELIKILKSPDGVPQGYVEEVIARMNRFAGLTACNIPLEGAPDVRHRRGQFIDEDGVLRPESSKINVVETIDLKTIKRIFSRKILKGKNAGTILPGWAKTSAQVCSDAQMVGYARQAVNRHPDATHHRLSHVYAQKESKGAVKRTGLISVQQVLDRWHGDVEPVVAKMISVATAAKIEDVQPNTFACDSFTHVAPNGEIKPGCGHRYYCPLPNSVMIQNMLGNYKESAMSLFDQLPPGVLPNSSAPVSPTAPPPPVPPPPPVLDAAAERAAIEAEKAKLRAEDSGGRRMETQTMPCGAPGCGVNSAPGWVKTTSNAEGGGFQACERCKGKGITIKVETGPVMPQVAAASPPPPAPPPPSTGAGIAVTPPDAPVQAPLVTAAKPMPPEEIEKIEDPALKQRAAEHAAQNAALAQQQAAQELAEKQAAGTAVWCKVSGMKMEITPDMAIGGKFVCSCTKPFSLKTYKPVKTESGKYELEVPRHKPVNKAAAEPPHPDDDSDEEEMAPPPPPAASAAPPPPPPAPPAPPIAAAPPPAPPPPPAGEMTKMVEGMFGPPNGTNGHAPAPPLVAQVSWLKTPEVLALLQSIDASLKQLVIEVPRIGYLREGKKV